MVLYLFCHVVRSSTTRNISLVFVWSLRQVVHGRTVFACGAPQWIMVATFCQQFGGCNGPDTGLTSFQKTLEWDLSRFPSFLTSNLYPDHIQIGLESISQKATWLWPKKSMNLKHRDVLNHRKFVENNVLIILWILYGCLQSVKGQPILNHTHVTRLIMRAVIRLIRQRQTCFYLKLINTLPANQNWVITLTYIPWYKRCFILDITNLFIDLGIIFSIL